MLTKTLYYLCYFFSLLGILFGIITYDRWNKPYNELGRYYDSKDSIVYHYQEMELFAVISGLSLFIAIILFLFAFIRSR
jgi:hypothetical protein